MSDLALQSTMISIDALLRDAAAPAAGGARQTVDPSEALSPFADLLEQALARPAPDSLAADAEIAAQISARRIEADSELATTGPERLAGAGVRVESPDEGARSGLLEQLAAIVADLLDGARMHGEQDAAQTGALISRLQQVLRGLGQADDISALDFSSLLTGLGAEATFPGAGVDPSGLVKGNTDLARALLGEGGGSRDAAVASLMQRLTKAGLLRDSESPTLLRAAHSASGGEAVSAAASADDTRADDRRPVLGPDRSKSAAPRIVVVDLRTAAGKRHEALASRAAGTAAAAVSEGPTAVGQLSNRLLPQLFADASGAKLGSAAWNAEVAPGTPADQPRLTDLRTQLPDAVARHTNILVRDGGGEIRLVLRPESLGSVRINVTIENGSLEGRIFVENASVRDVIESNLASLRAALREEGFANAALDVSVDERGQGGQRRGGDPDEAGDDAATSLAGASPSYLDANPDDRYSDRAVNLVV
jgi:flagellar hook-length control protein FliK